MNLKYIIAIIATVYINVSAKHVASNKKINSQMLTVGDLGDYKHRISPKHRITFTNQDNLLKSRSKRDTLLNLYRQQQLYNKVNKNIMESYFQTPSDSSTFKKLNVNPYKDVHQQNRLNRYNSEQNRNKVYRKHPGFKVTDSVNHLKYLVDSTTNSNSKNSNNNKNNDEEPEPQPNDPESLESTINKINKMDPQTREELLRKIIGSTDSNDSDNNLNRQRRGEFVHNKLKFGQDRKSVV